MGNVKALEKVALEKALEKALPESCYQVVSNIRPVPLDVNVFDLEKVYYSQWMLFWGKLVNRL